MSLGFFNLGIVRTIALISFTAIPWFAISIQNNSGGRADPQRRSDQRQSDQRQSDQRQEDRQSQGASRSQSRSQSSRSDERTSNVEAQPIRGESTRAQNPMRNNTDSRTEPANRRVNTEREAAALMLVKQHHPELTRLLNHLKENRRNDYARAIRELFRKSEQLASIQERGDDERYKLELNIWKTDSRARLLAARLAQNDRDDIRERLERVLTQHFNYKRQLIERDRNRLADRLVKMDQNLERIDSNFDGIVEREMQVLMRQMQTSMGHARDRKSGATGVSAPGDADRQRRDAGDNQ